MQKLSAIIATAKTLEARKNRLDAILEEYELHDETYCRDYKMLVRLESRVNRHIDKFLKKSGRLFAKYDRILSKFYDKR